MFRSHLDLGKPCSTTEKHPQMNRGRSVEPAGSPSSRGYVLSADRDVCTFHSLCFQSLGHSI